MQYRYNNVYIRNGSLASDGSTGLNASYLSLNFTEVHAEGDAMWGDPGVSIKRKMECGSSNACLESRINWDAFSR
jgi:hypothetical protein